jgi:phosphinothricin acetyltransferase
MANIRAANAADADAISAIYGPYCDGTVISFEETAPTADEMARRIASIGETRPWIVLEDGGAIIGYAYASAHNDRAAYRWSVSTAIYISRDHHRRGAGRALYTTLFALLRALGYRQATAGITLPNPASVGLHGAFGFVPVGAYRQIGYKMGGWHDVGWYQAEIQPGAVAPTEPLSVRELAGTSAWDEAVQLGLELYRAVTRNKERNTNNEKANSE